MKKMFYLIPAIVIFMLWIPQTMSEGKMSCSDYMDLNPYDESYFKNLLDKITGTINPNISFDTNLSFGGAFGYPGKNLYMETYYKTQSGPYSEAVKYTATQTGFTELEVKQILEGSMTPILNRKKNMENSEAITISKEVAKVFADENAILGFRQDMFDSTAPTELFSNGDISDSGFDLIVDLNIIEKILFGGDEAVGVNGASGGNGNNGGSGSNGNSGGNNGEAGNNGGSDSNSKTNDDIAGQPQGIAPTPNKGKDSKTGDGLDPASCLSAEPLETADFDYKKTIAAKNKNTTGSQNNNGQKDESDQTSGQGSEGNENEQKNEEEILPQKPDSWTEPELCTNLFCLEVNFLRDNKSTYKVEDNCIACHIEHIRDNLKETNSYNLTPKKITGNLFEPAVCKKWALDTSAINLQINFIGNPIVTPSNGDKLNKQGSFKEKWNQFFAGKGLSPTDLFSFSPDIKPATEKPATITEKVTDKVGSSAPANLPITALNEEIEGAIADEQRKLDDMLKEFNAVSKVGDQSLYFASMEYELDQMIAYFESYKKTFDEMNTEVCPKWQEMKDCD